MPGRGEREWLQLDRRLEETEAIGLRGQQRARQRGHHIASRDGFDGEEITLNGEGNVP